LLFGVEVLLISPLLTGARRLSFELPLSTLLADVFLFKGVILALLQLNTDALQTNSYTGGFFGLDSSELG